MTTFFTADHHFGHINIIKYQNRPFDSVEQMDEYMIDKWNTMVEKKDTVYHLGDFTLGNHIKANKYLAQLNGQIRVLANPWHHDKRWIPSKWFTSGYFSFSGIEVEILPPIFVLEYPEYGNGSHSQVVVLCHYPFARWERSHFGSWHLHGHSHGNYQGEGLIMDVGVDCNDFRPVRLEDVYTIMASKDKAPLSTSPTVPQDVGTRHVADVH